MRTLRIAALVLASAAFGSARAQTPEQPQEEHRGLSLLLDAGQYAGFGGGLGFGNRAVGVRAVVGWAPLIINVEQGSSSELKFYSSLVVAPDLYLRLFEPRPTTDLGALAGYRYNSALGHGFAVGGYARARLSTAVDVNISVGVLVFPDGENRLRQDKNIPSTTSFEFPGPKVHFGINAGLAFFP
jgi:hypothetical protein